ncbi:Uncharacterised protein [Klebsiella pneumoniae]|uniref:hypothetical protein n=1 Tax=Klebsiella pneumoniae TaxID=573 RepID=UPI000E2C240F|nr:hypothetical protein [Klebsiella pneumoniae]SVZ68491.1 Uncharacterised protein [Klebsiella pneumoniae]SVZ95858.1 Uncharacterised protein [Klebsiella pneumoniae]SWA17721.1 Uncharacterised protein [Klebsiella pneumoniae]
MTDITELAQSEINDALAQLKQISEYPTPSTQYARVLRKYIATMVETLEKAKGMEAYWKTQCRGITDHCEELQARIAELESRTVTAAAADVLAERQRQVTAEGWTAERDDGYQNSELADAAACYAIHAHNQGFSTPAHWPWSQDWWKQTSPRRDLVKAGALILAEIERLDRAAGIKVEAE